jgi:hypothetical protein
MIKARGTMFLDGDFKKAHPTPGVHSYRDEDGKWSVTKFGPRYVNVYEVTEFDADGERWLKEHQQ